MAVMTQILFRVCCAIFIVTHVTSAKVRGRGRRSDDGGRMEIVVNALSQRVDELTAHNTAQDTRLQQLEAKNAQLTSSISSLQTRLDAVEQPVAFTARFSRYDVTGLGKGQTLKFDQVVYNAGSGYNPTTGLFTAPSSGTYIFIVQLMRHGADSTVGVGVYKGATYLARAYACCSVDEAVSATVTVHLQQGESVHLQITEGSSLYGNTHTAFSGARLSPL